MIVLFTKSDGRVFAVHDAPDLDPADFETDETGALEYLGDDSVNLMRGEWWAQLDVPVVGSSSVTEVAPPQIANVNWSWAVHGYVPDVVAATDAAKSRVAVGLQAYKEGAFEWSGYTFLGTQAEQVKVNSYAIEALIASTSGSTFHVDWRLADDTLLTLDAPEMLAVFTAMQARLRAADDRSTALLGSIASAGATTPALSAVLALNAIDWSPPPSM